MKKLNMKPTFHPTERSVKNHQMNIAPGFHYVDTTLVCSAPDVFTENDEKLNKKYIEDLEKDLKKADAIILSRDIYPVSKTMMRYRVLYAIGQRDPS